MVRCYRSRWWWFTQNFFIFSSKEVSDATKQRHIDYLAKPKKDRTQRKGGSLRHFEPSEEFKVERKNNWEIMFKWLICME